MSDQTFDKRPIFLYTDSTYFSGAEKSLAILANELHTQGTNIKFFCTAKTADRFLTYIPKEVTEATATQLKFSLSWLLTLISYCKRERPQVIAVNMWSPYANTLALLAGRLTATPTLGIYHYYEEKQSIKGILRPLKLLAYGLGGRLCSRILTVSDAHRKVLIEQFGFPPDKVHVLHNGILENNLHKVSDDHTPRRLLAVGSLEPAKGYDFLISMVKKVTIPLILTIAGEGLERERLENLAENSPHPIHFLGTVTQIQSLYEQHDILVHPSHFENLSMAILEAMSYGLAVIANNVGGNKELITHNSEGWLLELDNQEAWLNIIELACSKPLTQYRLNALQASKKFSASLQAESFLKQITTIV